MGLAYIDGVLRGAAAALFLLLGWRFARDWGRSLTTKIGVVLMVGAASYVALLAVDSAFGFANPWRLPLHVLSLASPGLFWLFTASLFDDEFELRWWHLGFVAAMVVTGLVSNYLWIVENIRLYLLMLGWRAFSLVAIGLTVQAMVRGWSGDLIEARRHVRARLVVASAIAILWIVASEVWSSGWPPPVEWRVANAAGMLILAAIVAGAVLGWRDPALLAPPERARARAEFDDAPLLSRLDTEMRHERLYRQDGLTITAVAARMGVPEYRLRRAINQGLGARNFNAYLNGFRLKEAEEALADPAQREVPILTIAMDAGFGSLAPFNRAFRLAHGRTPTEYRAQRLA